MPGLGNAPCVVHGAPRVIRTPDLRIRSPTLYPSELWAHSLLLFTLWRGSRRCSKDFNRISCVLPPLKGISDFHPFPDTGITRRDINGSNAHGEIYNLSLIPFDADNPSFEPSSYASNASLKSRHLLSRGNL
jgi:hypothetical protein